jgi:hypothetical protein
MARYRGTIQGNRGEASRLGHQGLDCEANGWRIGGRMTMEPAFEGTKLDKVSFTYTAGSDGRYMLGKVADCFEGLFMGETRKFIRFPECFGGKVYILHEGEGIESPDRWEEINCSWIG